MKTSIFNMTLTLPPMLEMYEVEKELPTWSATGTCNNTVQCGGC